MATRIQIRRGTAAEWTAANPVLANGEPAYEEDTGLQKIGDGVTTWNLLGYAGAGIGLLDPTGAGEIMISTGSDSEDWELQPAAAPYGNAPNPDTEEGSEGASNTFAVGDHSHRRSGLYDAFGRDDCLAVGDAGPTLTVPDVEIHQATTALLTEDCTIDLPEAHLGARLKLFLEQDGIGGWTRAYPANVTWAGGTPVWSTAPGLIDMVELYCFDDLNWLGTAVVLGVERPAPPMNIVQEVHVPSFFTASFADEVTPGNAVLLYRSMVSPVPTDPPTGGGCSNWTKIYGPFANRPGLDADTIDVWIGTASVGGPGSEALDAVEQCIVAKFWEIAGVAADVSEAFTAPVLRTIANMGATSSTPPWDDEWTPDPITSEQSGSMPVFFATSAIGVADIGDGSVNFAVQPVPAPWITGDRIPDYQGNDNTYSPRMFYQLSSADGEDYAPTFRRRNDNGNAYGVNALAFFLKR